MSARTPTGRARGSRLLLGVAVLLSATSAGAAATHGADEVASQSANAIAHHSANGANQTADDIARRSANGANQTATDIARLEATVKAYETELALLRSRRAIENLQAAYGYYFDKGQWRQVADLFSTGASFEFGQRGVYVGRAHILKALSTLFGPEGLRAGQLNNYMML